MDDSTLSPEGTGLDRNVFHVVPQIPFTTHTFIVQTISVVRDEGWEPHVYAGRRRWRQPQSLRLQDAGVNRIGYAKYPLVKGALQAPRDVRRALSVSQGVRLSKHLGVVHGKRILHAHFAARPLEIALHAAEHERVPVVVTAHAADLFAAKDTHVLARQLSAADAVVTISQRGYNYAQELLSHTRVQVELIPCSLPTTISPQPAPGTGQRVVTVGRLVEKKGIDLVLRMAERMLAADPSLTWTLVGTGPLEPAVKRFAHAQRRFFHEPSLSHQRVWDLLASASVFVLPSRRTATGDEEGIPIAILEAMALGVPVVAGRSGGVGEVVRPGETGWLLDADTNAISDWCAAIEEALSPNSVSGAKAAQRETLRDRSPIAEGRAYAALYDRLLN
jgi:glycosyltransferase involved in cell wall biosynthesis